MATLKNIHEKCGAQTCQVEAEVYAIDPYPDGWGGWFCSTHAEGLGWTIVDTIDNTEV